MTDFKILSIVVLYKQNVLDCTTITSMISLNDRLKNDICLVVCDNSEQRQLDSDIHVLSSYFKEFAYLHTGCNTPLSILYNNTIASYGYLCTHVNIWDQDSSFTDDYFEQCKKVVYNQPDVSLIVPRIFVGKKLVSPGEFNGFKGKYLKGNEIGIVGSKGVVGVMSGVFINIDVFSKIAFDERFRFYGVDTKFYIDHSKIREELFVLEYVLKHSLSEFDKTESIEVKKFRFKEFYNSIKLLNENLGFCKSIFVRIYLFYVALKKENCFSKGVFIRIALGF